MATRRHLSVFIVNFDKTSHTAQCLYSCFENACLLLKLKLQTQNTDISELYVQKKCISSGYIDAIVV